MPYHRNDLDPAFKGEGAARTVPLPAPQGGYGQERLLLLILATGLWILAPVLAAENPPSEAPAAVKGQVQAYATLPLSFEANQGQTVSEVKFLAHGAGYALFLTPTEAVLSLNKPQARSTFAGATPISPWTQSGRCFACNGWGPIPHRG